MYASIKYDQFELGPHGSTQTFSKLRESSKYCEDSYFFTSYNIFKSVKIILKLTYDWTKVLR